MPGVPKTGTCQAKGRIKITVEGKHENEYEKESSGRTEDPKKTR